MRDVEAFTDIYYKELRLTPTGRDPVIRKFMDRWHHEEAQHADLLHRFLGEAGVPTEQNWYERTKSKIPRFYKISSFLSSSLANFVGKHFSAVHMVWGAINELTTYQGYRQLWQAAKHPVLELILRAIASEERIHIFFYRSIARLKLQRSPFAQKIARFIIEKFWSPVGEGTKPKKESDYVISTLFSGLEGIKIAHDKINDPIARLPGFENCQKITKRIAQAA